MWNLLYPAGGSSRHVSQWFDRQPITLQRTLELDLLNVLIKLTVTVQTGLWQQERFGNTGAHPFSRVEMNDK